MSKEVLIIIPAYNEAENIGNVLDQLETAEVSGIADVLIMNDASTDGTNWIVKKRGHKVVTHVFNLGYGSALQLGYKYAVRRGYEYVIQMDADGQHDVCNIPELYKALKTPDENGVCPDIVIGSRYMNGEWDSYPTGHLKRFAIRLFRTMIRNRCHQQIWDPTSGLQGLSFKAFLYYSMYNRFDDRYPDANMIMQMMLLGFKITEIPAVMHVRTAGKSMHSGLGPVYYMIRMFVSMLAIDHRYRLLRKGKGDGPDVYIQKENVRSTIRENF